MGIVGMHVSMLRGLKPEALLRLLIIRSGSRRSWSFGSSPQASKKVGTARAGSRIAINLILVNGIDFGREGDA